MVLGDVTGTVRAAPKVLGRRRFAASLVSTVLIGTATAPVVPTASAQSPQIYFRHNVSQAFASEANPVCKILYLSKNEPLSDPATNQPFPLGAFQGVFTDAVDLVPYAQSNPPFYHLDDREFLEFPRSHGEVKMGVRRVSFLFPPMEEMDQVMWSVLEEAREHFPDDVYFDTGRAERIRAFENYTFSFLLSVKPTLVPTVKPTPAGSPQAQQQQQQQGEFVASPAEIPSQTLLDCVAYSVVPGLVWWDWQEPPPEVNNGQPLVMKHFLDYCYYFKYAVAKFKFPHFIPQIAVEYIMHQMHSDAIFVMQSSLRLVQDFFWLRYRNPFETNLKQHAETICREKEQQQLTPFVFIVILSAKENFNRRQAMRDTWLKVLENDIPRKVRGKPHVQIALANTKSATSSFAPPPADFETVAGAETGADQPLRAQYRFFVNRVGSDREEAEDMDWMLRGEADLWRDMVFLDVEREYPIGNQGIASFSWVANYTDAP